MPVVLFSVLWNVPKFFELQTCYLPQNSSADAQEVLESLNETMDTYDEEFLIPQVCETELRLNYTYCRDYILIANFFVNTFMSFLLLAIFNCQTFITIRKASRRSNLSSNRQERDHSIAVMLSIVVLVFVICSLPRIVLNIWEVRRNSYR